MMQAHQLGGSSANSGIHHQSATASSQHQMHQSQMPDRGIAGGMGVNVVPNGSAGANSSAAGGANTSAHNTGMGLSSGGPNIHLLNMVESGDADDGGRDGETRYFNDVTQDEGTGGESYT